MVLVVLGIDALDPDLVDPARHRNLALSDYRSIETVESSAGEPSTHELWPTIITGLPPSEHGILLDDGVAWDNSLFRFGSKMSDYLLPNGVQSRIGGWLLTNTQADAFRVPATYYRENDLSTVFDDWESAAIGIPNYVEDTSIEDKEHNLRRSLGTLFERDPEATGGHTSSDPYRFYEQCMEMAMTRIARARRGLRGGYYELVFAYTSGLDLIGHVTYDLPEVQMAAYDELDEFVGDVRDDLDTEDELLLVSDHGLQEGIHTSEAMVAATDPSLIEDISSVLDVRESIETELERGAHGSSGDQRNQAHSENGEEVKRRLEDLGYI